MGLGLRALPTAYGASASQWKENVLDLFPEAIFSIVITVVSDDIFHRFLSEIK